MQQVAETVNEIIDHLNSKDHIVEKHEKVESEEVFPDTGKKVEWDWIIKAMNMYVANRFSNTDYNAFREAIEQHMTKTVEPVLIPLDVKKIRDEFDKYRAPFTPDYISSNYKRFEAILSKYWVPKQEEEWYASPQEALEDYDRQIKESVGIDTTPPVTSTIEEVDIEKAVTKIWQLIFGACHAPQHPYNKELKEILSSLSPIQKKRTRFEVIENIKKNNDALSLCPRDYIAQSAIILFLSDHNLLQE